MKRFKAVVIGGTGYGGAEMIRRLLIHPDVELVRVVAVDHVGEPLGAAHPPLNGRSELRFENIPPAEAARGCDVALLGLPHKVSAQHAPAILATGAKVVDMSGDFRLRDAAAYARYYGATHPHPEAARDVRLRAARAEPRGDPEGARGRLAGLLRDHHRARPAAAGARRPAGRRRPRRRHHRLVGQRRRAVGGHAPPGARGEPEDLQAARAPAHAGDRRDAGGGGRAPAGAAVRAGLGAAVARDLRHQLRRGAGERDAEPIAALYADAYDARAVRALRARSPARGRGGRRQQLRRGRLHAGTAGAARRARWRS